MLKDEAIVKDFISALIDAGYEPESYSGRGMFGKSCVSVSGDEDERVSAWEIAKSLWWNAPDGEAMDIPEPRQDQLGLGIVLYWPSFEWPKESA